MKNNIIRWLSIYGSSVIGGVVGAFIGCVIIELIKAGLM
jgi:hypothetical protein